MVRCVPKVLPYQMPKKKKLQDIKLFIIEMAKSSCLSLNIYGFRTFSCPCYQALVLNNLVWSRVLSVFALAVV